MTLRAAIFDFGGVFTDSPVTRFVEYERRAGLPTGFLSGVIKARLSDGAFAQFEKAEITLDAFDTAFAEETRAAGHEVTGRTLVGLLRLKMRPDMVDLLERVKAAGFLTGCITNNMPGGGAEDWAEADEDKRLARHTLALFDHVIESAKAGMRKPEPRIYEIMCETLDVAPAEAMFVDDLGVNLKPAAAMGMLAVKVAFADHRPALREIEEALGLSSDQAI